MGETDYNLSAYARAIGSKALAAMHFVNAIQPTVQVADLTSLSPAHQPPLAAFGATTIAVAGQRGKFEIASRGPGGCFIVDFRYSGGLFVSANYAVQGVTAGLATPLNPQTFSNQAPQSTCSVDLSVTDPLPGITFPLVNGSLGFPIGAWIPPGQFVLFAQRNNNITAEWSCTIADVPVSEGGDGLPPV